jgi:hypothetical protein
MVVPHSYLPLRDCETRESPLLPDGCFQLGSLELPRTLEARSQMNRGLRYTQLVYKIEGAVSPSMSVAQTPFGWYRQGLEWHLASHSGKISFSQTNVLKGRRVVNRMTPWNDAK